MFIVQWKEGIYFWFFWVFDTLFAYIVQFVMSSESIAPKSPKSAPEAPTDMVGFSAGLRLRDESKLPPKPESTYKHPIFTAKTKKKKKKKKHKHKQIPNGVLRTFNNTLWPSLRWLRTCLRVINACWKATSNIKKSGFNSFKIASNHNGWF